MIVVVVVILQAIIIAQMEGRGNQIMITLREKYINKHRITRTPSAKLSSTVK